MTIPSPDASVAALPVATWLTIGVAALLVLLLVYWGFRLGATAVRTARGYLRYRFARSELFDEAIYDDAWFPSRLPVEPDDSVYYTDSERVLRLLIANEGRMQQAAIIRETGWSSAKVSRLLHRMETRNDVSRVSVGRAKVVYLGQYRTNDAESEPL